ncbi:hypothetical protein D9757_013714 [Collybiopsis confluens]|uniref:Uncharacterized protein n=1 Tax=Collybiopsis confluens TaxID=2823264 RepID=A0A8H5FYM6_9AGAR|nr:hypothetical protein D9757_013714 [Collybiopsis confluens]
MIIQERLILFPRTNSLYVSNPEQSPRINRTKPVTTPVYPSEPERERYSPSARLQEAVEILGSIVRVRSVGCNNAGVVHHCASSLDSAPTSASTSASLSSVSSSTTVACSGWEPDSASTLLPPSAIIAEFSLLQHK